MSFRYPLMLAVGLAIALTATVQAEVIGRWNWTGGSQSQQLENKHNPGTYDAVLRNGAQLNNSLLEVRANAAFPTINDDEHASLGVISEMQGATQFTMRFEDVVLRNARTTSGSTDFWDITGSLAPAAWNSSSHNWRMQISRSTTTGNGTFMVALWGDDINDINLTDRQSNFSMGNIPIDDSADGNLGDGFGLSDAYDFEVIYDSSNGNVDNLGFRMKESNASIWGAIQWLSNDVVELNSNVYETTLGKNRIGSSTIRDMDMGQVTLSIPEPGSLTLVGAVGALLLRRRR